MDVRLTQREVILARKSPGLKLSNAQSGQYAAYVTVPTVIGVPVALPWAWASVDVTRNGRSFRFATTHLDPISEHRPAAAGERIPGWAWEHDAADRLGWRLQLRRRSDLDLGVPSATATYGSIIAAGFTDAWAARHSSIPASPAARATNLLNPTSTLAERVDLVLTRGPFHVGKALLVGDAASNRLPSGLWPSDHAGVVVTLELESGG